MPKFIIRKSCRSGLAPYAGPSCQKAKIVPGQIYMDKIEAEADAAKLNSVNPVGFVVIEIGEVKT